MKIDLSTVFLVILVVIPGLFAQRSRDLLVPRSLRAKGATEELAELVALGIATHGVLICTFALALTLLSLCLRIGPQVLFQRLDASHPLVWSNTHPIESSLLCAGYVFLSFFVSHCLGVIYGIFGVKGKLTARFIGSSRWLRRLGVEGSTGVGDRPIIYDLLHTNSQGLGEPSAIFVEAELKNNLGFYSGQLNRFAVVPDEEAHRPIYLIDPWFKKERDAEYARLQADGIMLDLADVVVLSIKEARLSSQPEDESAS